MKLHQHFLQPLLAITTITCILLSTAGCGCQKKEESQIAEESRCFFKIERIDIPESEEERQQLKKQNFKNAAEDAYTG